MMSHTRETRAAAAELKFLIDASLAPDILQWARQHLAADPHGTGSSGDEYDIATIYFDTPQRDVFDRRGSFGRAKYRVRRYNGSPVLFLERKLRRPGLLIKRRSRDDEAALARLDSRQRHPDWDGDWFHRRLLARALGPVCQVAYHRVARTAGGDSTVRMTLDSQQRAAPAARPEFSVDRGVQVLDGRSVLELKYRGQLPAVFRRLVERFALTADPASKYRFAMIALGHVPGPRPAVEVADRGSDCTYA